MAPGVGWFGLVAVSCARWWRRSRLENPDGWQREMAMADKSAWTRGSPRRSPATRWPSIMAGWVMWVKTVSPMMGSWLIVWA
jgi:hypothetical protein